MTVGYLPWNRPAPAANRPCLRDERNELTYAEVGQRVAAFAEELAERGLGPGDVLGIMLPNRVELLIGLLAAWRVGAAVTPVNPAFTENEAGYQLRDSGARLVLNGGPDAPSAGLPAIHVDEMRRAARGNPPEREIRPDELALLVYTSGSTGRPKGVMLDHANLDAMVSAMAEHFRATDADHCLLVLPLFHVNAICVSFLTMMLSGGQLTVLERFDPKSFLAAVERYRPTYFSAVPTIYARLAELPGEFAADTSSLRFAVCGAAPVSRELLEHCESRFGFAMVEGYGLTEGTCASACNPVDGVRKLGTVGPALPGQRIATISPEGDHLPAGAVGEVVIQGANVMRGYLNRPEETATTLAGGWLRTGDVGRIDEDGYLTLVDRLKDMIIRGGENVYPKEIESVLHGHPGVLEAAVVGVPHAVYGEVPVACVVPYPDAVVTVEELLERCRADLTKIKLPVEIHLLDALPKNPVGKIDKPTLRKALHGR
ncbi:Acyl-CoA synthetase (AMP-forming)/AMP-acid ligase II [Saccharopolyspora antimicrobica]|uniref:Acyl-CoA synthetase (AMP-forming)/AMP-acid ligase II n=1 Tax=Saccharopolyspora antimicrobica TaxID=455193 RepID=A0A1I4U7B0_9PSEU|nr:AMP-binding protein [Saccharopolyspora antimicrobica]RKT88713.1 acyl-CoA synthetase (AMP-forming)/AMP-acid ligase II [Saccharopolyspora antimicrobica]SFM84730.1 Acyl-CoA synthetase (AMP-forming)/AMP-acid ligase II [Saccharopolyspora antimicrobica]